MNATSLSGMGAPLLALRVLSVDYPHLPAPRIALCTIYPERLELSFHNDLGAFEAWREALGIDPLNVAHHVQRDGRTCVLTVHVDYAGAELHLTGFGDVPAVEETRSRVEVPA
ncbi:hypothetical protein ABZV60_12440 [Streptomyces sp. NPDC004787]|uniref:hypothetical protein n=1 Tax=Streptomyces sp. NPDC004787 TaxID=3154291 RepID=UPI0033B9BEC8